MVGTAGFEPATPASRTLCSSRLSHVPTTFACLFMAEYITCQLKNIIYISSSPVSRMLQLNALLIIIVSFLPGPTDIISIGVSVSASMRERYCLVASGRSS